MSDAPPARILIVDDEAAQMKALCDTLRDHGYETAGFTRGQVALAALREKKYDLLLADLTMPEMDGIAVLRAALEIDPYLVGIMMTGHGSINTAVEAMKAGALDYVLKPFKLSAMLPVLSRALTVRRLRMENVQLQQYLRERTVELEAANKELEAFSYSISHDLRAPLRRITNYIDLLTQDERSVLSEKTREYLSRVSNSAQEMNRLIDDLLAFSRTARAEMRQMPFNMSELVNDVIKELSGDAQGRNIEWDVQPLPTVKGDSALLRQVWVNLLSNAIKYTRPSNPAKIKIGAVNTGSAWEFYVQDNGVGFNMQYVEKLFGVFQRLHGPAEFEGTGIGLANVRQIVTRHGGRTRAEGEVGKGATIFFSLPN